LTSSEFRYASAIMLLNELPRQMKWIITLVTLANPFYYTTSRRLTHASYLPSGIRQQRTVMPLMGCH